MFSGCCTQITVSWTKSLSYDRRPIFFYTVFYSRQFWTAHINDRKRNDRLGKLIHPRVLHSEAAPERHLYPKFLAIDSKPDHSILLLPWPQGQEQHLPSLGADSCRKLSDNKALKEPEKDAYVDSATRFLPDSSFNDESLLEKAARPLKPSQIRRWEQKLEYRRSLNDKLQDKSAWSHDWRVPLNLLKEYYRAADAGAQNHRDLIREAAARAKTDSLTDTIPEPEQWTKATFDCYVFDLQWFTPPTLPTARALGLRRQREGPHTINGIGQTLHKLFHRSDLRQFFNPQVCNAAIEFLTRHAMLRKARSILFVMEDLSMSITFSTINIFMRAAAHQKDLHHFILLLSTMIKRDIYPDAETWVIFVRCLDSIAAKRLVITEMAALGILNKPDITKKVLMATVKDDMIEFLASKKEPRDFLYQMRLKHGPDWMSRRTGNVILNQVCKRVSLSAGLDLIEPMKQHGFSPDSFTLRIPFFQALTAYHGSLPLATYVLDVFARRQYPIHFGREAWEPLFFRAWKLGYLNVIRVVWIAACLHGSVTYKMLEIVDYSLRLSALQHKPADYAPSGTPTRLPLRHKVFRTLMGRFILGIDPHKDASWNEGQRAITDYIRTAETAKLRFSLSFNLKEAYKVDLEWMIEKGKDVSQKLEHRYPVLLDTVTSQPDRPSLGRPRGGWFFDGAELVQM